MSPVSATTIVISRNCSSSVLAIIRLLLHNSVRLSATKIRENDKSLKFGDTQRPEPSSIAALRNVVSGGDKCPTSQDSKGFRSPALLPRPGLRHASQLRPKG